MPTPVVGSALDFYLINKEQLDFMASAVTLTGCIIAVLVAARLLGFLK